MDPGKSPGGICRHRTTKLRKVTGNIGTQNDTKGRLLDKQAPEAQTETKRYRATDAKKYTAPKTGLFFESRSQYVEMNDLHTNSADDQKCII